MGEWALRDTHLLCGGNKPVASGALVGYEVEGRE